MMLLMNVLFDWQVAHEHLFFEDDLAPSNLGFGKDGLFTEPFPLGYLRTDGGYNDCVMRMAATENQWPGSAYGVCTNNCQNWAMAVREAYNRLIKDAAVRETCSCQPDLKTSTRKVPYFNLRPNQSYQRFPTDEKSGAVYTSTNRSEGTPFLGITMLVGIAIVTYLVIVCWGTRLVLRSRDPDWPMIWACFMSSISLSACCSRGSAAWPASGVGITGFGARRENVGRAWTISGSLWWFMDYLEQYGGRESLGQCPLCFAKASENVFA